MSRPSAPVSQRRQYMLGLQTVVILSAVYLAFLLRFDFSIPANQLPLLIRGALLALGIKSAVFILLRVHRGSWQRVGTSDLLRIALANAAASCAFSFATLISVGHKFPRSIFGIDFLLCFVLTAFVRSFARLSQEIRFSMAASNGKGVLIYGAGAAGSALAREIRSNPRRDYRVLGFLDDDPAKAGERLDGIAVLGNGRSVATVIARLKHRGANVEEVILAMATATSREIREALANCRSAGVPCRTIPSVGELLNGKVLSNQIRDLSVNDLLGREPVRLEEDRIRTHIQDRVVLITGAGGSIGSELSRQIAAYGPRVLILLDQAESDLFRIDLDLRGKFPGRVVIPAIGNIQDAVRIETVFREYSIDCVFHAAAYKHVPMMEAHLKEAVQNNVMGTWNLVCASRRHRVPNFLMISSDKAVNPTSVMGMTKRVCELIVAAGGGPSARFVSVRFGNVLGSNGSVVPIFQELIARREPVAVTHPDIRRYFMTIREAVQLVLQASTMGSASELFVLEMGEPVRIADLAANMIRLAGLVPGEDIEIRYTGLRPGEKLFEELITEGENIQPTHHNKIKIMKGVPPEFEVLNEWICHLETILEAGDESQIMLHLLKLVPEYRGSRLQRKKALAVKERNFRFAEIPARVTRT